MEPIEHKAKQLNIKLRQIVEDTLDKTDSVEEKMYLALSSALRLTVNALYAFTDPKDPEYVRKNMHRFIDDLKRHFHN